MTGLEDAIAENVKRVRGCVARAVVVDGRRAEDVALVAVSKTFPAEVIAAGFAVGLRQFGENRVQEFERKRAGLQGLSACWHLIGHLQSNKARKAARLFDCVDSVDSMDLARRLDVARAELAASSTALPTAPLKVLLEVRLSSGEAKSGVSEEGLAELVECVRGLRNLKLEGLMTIPPFTEEPEGARPFFRRLRGLRDIMEKKLGMELPELSMGMSHDFEVAIEEGATQVRIGTGIFGARATHEDPANA
jgi:pyridoxal phosphate enzyme (YggS family)